MSELYGVCPGHEASRIARGLADGAVRMPMRQSTHAACARGLLAAAAGLAMAIAAATPAAAQGEEVSELDKLTIEDLGEVDITSVSKKAEPVTAAPSAVYVITNRDIQSSGVLSLPEALRLAPNLQVARQ